MRLPLDLIFLHLFTCIAQSPAVVYIIPDCGGDQPLYSPSDLQLNSTTSSFILLNNSTGTCGPLILYLVGNFGVNPLEFIDMSSNTFCNINHAQQLTCYLPTSSSITFAIIEGIATFCFTQSVWGDGPFLTIRTPGSYENCENERALF